MDIEGFANLTLVGLVALGAVNVVGFFKPDMDSRVKFAISFLVAFIVTFIPINISNMILQNAKMALESALAASGIYKLSQKMGGQGTTSEGQNTNDFNRMSG